MGMNSLPVGPVPVSLSIENDQGLLSRVSPGTEGWVGLTVDGSAVGRVAVLPCRQARRNRRPARPMPTGTPQSLR